MRLKKRACIRVFRVSIGWPTAVCAKPEAVPASVSMDAA